MGSFNPFKMVKSLVSGPATPKAPEPVKIPTEQESAADIAQAAEEEKQRRKTQKGRAATILSRGVLGDDTSSGAGLATKKLMGG